MRILFLIVFLSFNTMFLFSQEISFKKTFGGIYWNDGNAIRQTKDGGYVIIGNTGGFGPSQSDVFLIKIDNHGDTSWTKTYGGKGYDVGQSIEQTSDGGYLIGGSTTSFSADTHFKVYLIRTLSNGDTVWTRTYGSPFGSYCSFLKLTNDGGAVIVGTYVDQTPGNLYLIKINSNGDTLWTKNYKGKYDDSVYGGSCIQLTSDGGYIISGADQSRTNGDHGTLTKTNSKGEIIWTKDFTGWRSAEFYAVIPSSDNGFLAIGHSQKTFLTWEDILLIKTDANGDTAANKGGWVKKFGAPGTTSGQSIQPAPNNGFIISALSDIGNTTNVKLWLIRIDYKGDTLWTSTFGENVNPSGFAISTLDGGYAAVCTNAAYSSNDFKILMIKTDSMGKVIANVEKKPSINNSISIFPNPCSDNLIINFPKNYGASSINIFNALGKEVYSSIIKDQSTFQINVSEWSKAVYFVQIISGNHILNKKILVQ